MSWPEAMPDRNASKVADLSFKVEPPNASSSYSGKVQPI